MRMDTNTPRYSVRTRRRLPQFGFVFHRASRAERTLSLRETNSQYAREAAYWPGIEVLEEAGSVRRTISLAQRGKYFSRRVRKKVCR
jgi:hypothetical protein